MPDAKDDLLRPRPAEILALFPLGIVCGTLFGVLMNVVNGWISPDSLGEEYLALSYGGDSKKWMWNVQHGMIEGLLGAIAPSLILMIGIALISKLRCSLQVGFTVHLKVVALCLLSWLVSGFNSMLLALFWPNFSDRLINLSSAISEPLNYAWAVGSGYGVITGLILSTVATLFSFARKWRQIEKNAQI
ncbi:MAG TPA: hypothetical protein VF627_09610 [Abditibacterium sp.]